MQAEKFYRLKLVLLGDSGVGKTSIIQKIIFNLFIVNTNPTIGAAFQTFNIDNKYKIDVWDTAGQERFHSLIPMYLKGANIIFIVLSIDKSDKEIDDQINFWLNFIDINKAYLSKDFKMMLLFNKIDINQNYSIHKKYTEDTRFYSTITTSAKMNINIDKLKTCLSKICDDIAVEKKTNTSTAQSSTFHIPMTSIEIPNVLNIKEYYNNSKCSLL